MLVGRQLFPLGFVGLFPRLVGFLLGLLGLLFGRFCTLLRRYRSLLTLLRGMCLRGMLVRRLTRSIGFLLRIARLFLCGLGLPLRLGSVDRKSVV